MEKKLYAEGRVKEDVMYKKLFEKGHIGSLTLKNRVVMTAMTTGYAGLDGAPDSQVLRPLRSFSVQTPLTRSR